MTFYRYGDPAARPLPKKELERVRPHVSDWLAKYKDTPQIALALQLTEELMNYAPLYGFQYELDTVDALRHLKDHGVKPYDFLQRVIELYAVVEESPHQQFPSARVIHHALARAVLQLGSLGRWRCKRRVIEYMGERIAESLGVFSMSFLRHINKKRDERNALIAKASTFKDLS